MSSRRGRGEGSIYRRGSDGRWVGVLDLGWVGGRRRRHNVYGATRREVFEKLRAARREHELGRDFLAPSRTVAAWLAEWLVMKSRDGTRPATLDRYRQVINRHLVPNLGRKRLDQLKVKEVQDFLDDLSTGLAPASVAKVHAVLRSSLSDAERLGLVARNVAKSARPPSQVRPRRRVLTMTEARKLLTAAEGDRLEALFVVALATGLRRGELLGLRWSDLRPRAGELHVVQAVQRSGGELRIVEPKTILSRRVIPVPAVAVSAFRRHRTRQARERRAAGARWVELDLIFTSSLGTPMEPRNVNRRFNELREATGLEWVRLHDLRHACATFLLGNGVDPRTVMEILGHSTIRLTMDLYGHAMPERMRAAAAAMDSALRG